MDDEILRGNEKSTKKRRKLFNRRKESTRKMAMFNRRYFSNLRNNWEIKREDHLLPNAGTIFNFIEKDLCEMDILKDLSNVKDWHQIVTDEEHIEGRIQENIAILSWAYWQRLEGYETLDVSLSRERLVEDIGCIQQFYNAADGLIREYQQCFNIQLPLDIMCVYGLYRHFHTASRHFVMVPNQTRYDYIPAWISVAHEVAHIAIDEIENKYYPTWKKKEEMRKIEMKIAKIENIEETSIDSESIRRSLRQERIPPEAEKIIKNSAKLVTRIYRKVEKENEKGEIILKLLKKINQIYSILKSPNKSRKDHIFLYKLVLGGLKDVSGILRDIMNFLEDTTVSDRIKKKFEKEIMSIEFRIYSLMVLILEEQLSLQLFGNLETRNVNEFFEKWREIKRRANDIAETVLRIFEGDSGIEYLHLIDPRDMRHVYDSEHILADIIATLIAGEFYLYSLAFYRFLPSIFPSQEGIMYRRQRMPMSLRLFICLETLRCSYQSNWEEMGKVIKRLEILWIQRATDHRKKERTDSIAHNLRNNIPDRYSKITIDLLWNLITSIMDEDLLLEEKYQKLLEDAEEGKEETKDKFDESYFRYMRHALGNALKKMLRDPKGFLTGIDCEGNCLEELIRLVEKNLIDPKELFMDKKRYEVIEKIREHLIHCELRFNKENYNNSPRNILSAYAQIYFEYILLNSKEEENEDYIKAFNATVMSLAWTQHALERFYDGRS